MVYPVTTELPSDSADYDQALEDFYDRMAEQIAAHLEHGHDVAVLCEGDPFFYGSYIYLHDRLAHRFPTEVIPGISSVTAATHPGSALRWWGRCAPMTVLPATLSEDFRARRAAQAVRAAFVIIKVGVVNFTKARSALRRAGIADRARYIERATMQAEQVLRLEEADAAQIPYFSLIVVPANEASDDKPIQSPAGEITVVGLGPGAPEVDNRGSEPGSRRSDGSGGISTVPRPRSCARRPAAPWLRQ